MNILLTGGAGYIGSHVCLSLLELGHNITVIDNLSTGNIKLIPPKAAFIECNINDVQIINSLLQKKKFDLLMHFAGFVQVEESVRNPKKYFDNNTENSKILFKRNYVFVRMFKSSRSKCHMKTYISQMIFRKRISRKHIRRHS